MHDSHTGAGGQLQLDLFIQKGSLHMDIPVHVEIEAVGGEPIFPGITREVFQIYGRSLSSVILGFQYRPGIHPVASDSLEGEGALQDAASVLETVEGFEPGFQPMLGEGGHLKVVRSILHLRLSAVK